MAEIRKLRNYINGEWVESKTDKYEDVVNPATKKYCAKCRFLRGKISNTLHKQRQKRLKHGQKLPYRDGREFFLTFSSF